HFMRARQRERLALEAGDDRSLLHRIGFGRREAAGVGRSGRCDPQIADLGGAGIRNGARGDEYARGRVGPGEMEVHAEVEPLGRVTGGGKRHDDGSCGAYDDQADGGESTVEAHNACSFASRLRDLLDREVEGAGWSGT